MSKQVRGWLSFLFGLGIAYSQLYWVGNTKLFLTNVGEMPRRDAFIETWQTVSVTTQTYPISEGQRVYAVVTTDNWRTTQEYVFNFDFYVGNNIQWYVVLGPYPGGTDVQFYIRAEGPNGEVLYDNNSGQNYGFYSRRAPPTRRDTILQWFETDYRTIMQRLPEVVMAGYGAIYLPPPQKSGGGGTSIGYNPFDHFDLGDRYQKGTVRTKYGTTQELIDLIRLAKRFGIEVYCDLITNHLDNRASTDIHYYPNLIPEDCHIHSSSDTSNGDIDFNNAPPFGWTTLNLDLLGLVDLAQEDRNNTRTGDFNLPPYASFNQWEKPTFIRQPLNPHYYPNGSPTREDIREYLKRWAWWLTTQIGFSGYRLDAVRHVPPGFFARILRQPGGQVSIGDLLPFLYSLNPNLYLFGEDYSSNNYELREYAKTGMNLLDFPMKFMIDNLFNSSGYGSLGSSLANSYGIDSGTGLTFELGGLASHLGVGFVQSHDLAPPWSNNLAYAWLLTRTGRPLVYYDGNNVDPNDWNHFPKPGRYDALGAGGDTLLRLLDARYRYARGTLVNRYVSDHLYIYERQVNGKGVLLVGLNNRGDQVELRATVQTAFAPGTLLVDLSNQKPPVVVDSNGRVTITVPYNSEDGNPNNGRGYVLYAQQSPLPLYDTPPIQLYDARYAGSGSPGREIEFQEYTLPAGRYAQPRTFQAALLTTDKINLVATTDTRGYSAFLKLDNGLPVAGREPLQNTEEGLKDGFVPLDKVSDGKFQLYNIDLSNLENGLHLFRVRVFMNTGNRPGIFSDFFAFFYLNRPIRGRALDGELSEYGTPLVVQTRNPSSNANRLDELYAHNDDQYLYLGIAGQVATDENRTNGVALFLDLDYGQNTGIRNFADLADDSGPAPRLLSNGLVTAPNGFGAEFGIGVFRQSVLHSAPESFFIGQEALPPTVGAQAGVYWLNPNRLNWLEPRAARIAWKPRQNRSDPPTGLELAVPLRTLYPNGLQGRTSLALVTYLLTTGETGAVLSSGDSRRGTYGGRLTPTAWLSNQFLPPQWNIVNDPGFSAVTLQTAAEYPLRFARTPSQPYRLRLSLVRYDSERQIYYQTGLLINPGDQPLEAPIYLRVRLPEGVELVNRTGYSLLENGVPYLVLSTSSLARNQLLPFRLEYRAPSADHIRPQLELKIGEGIL